jgi:hypothetical protein
MHVGVLAAIRIEGLPITGEFLRDRPVLLFLKPLLMTVEMSAMSRSASGWPATSALEATKNKGVTLDLLG